MKTPIILLLLVLVLAAGAVVTVVLIQGRVEPVVQPIQFNHKLHLDPKLDLTCNKCHSEVDKGPHATTPTIKTCLLCHKDAQGANSEEPKIREYAKAGKEIPWVQVNRVVGHVYFSHAAHVRYGKMDCKECHADIAEQTEPVTVSEIDHLTMSKCMACHEQKNASNDCLACHK